MHCLRKVGQLRGCNFTTLNILKPLITCTHPISICITTHCCQKKASSGAGPSALPDQGHTGFSKDNYLNYLLLKFHLAYAICCVI